MKQALLNIQQNKPILIVNCRKWIIPVVRQFEQLRERVELFNRPEGFMTVINVNETKNNPDENIWVCE